MGNSPQRGRRAVLSLSVEPDGVTQISTEALERLDVAWAERQGIARFARSTGAADAMESDNLLCYEMNGALPPEHGFPLRLIAPGW